MVAADAGARRFGGSAGAGGGALCNSASNNADNKSAIAAAGGSRPWSPRCAHAGSAGVGAAVRALRNLAFNNTDNRSAIAAAADRGRDRCDAGASQLGDATRRIARLDFVSVQIDLE